MEEFNGRRQPNGSLIEAPRGTGGNRSGAGAVSIPTSIAPLIERTFRHTSGLTAKMSSDIIPEAPKEEQLDPLIKESREFQIHCSAAHQNEHHRSVRQNPPTSIQRSFAADPARPRSEAPQAAQWHRNAWRYRCNLANCNNDPARHKETTCLDSERIQPFLNNRNRWRNQLRCAITVDLYYRDRGPQRFAGSAANGNSAFRFRPRLRYSPEK